jgi:hypothetical protein
LKDGFLECLNHPVWNFKLCGCDRQRPGEQKNTLILLYLRIYEVPELIAVCAPRKVLRGSLIIKCLFVSEIVPVLNVRGSPQKIKIVYHCISEMSSADASLRPLNHIKRVSESIFFKF